MREGPIWFQLCEAFRRAGYREHGKPIYEHGKSIHILEHERFGVKRVPELSDDEFTPDSIAEIARPLVEGFLKKSSNSLTAAEHLSERNLWDFAISRVYYGFMYGALALLLLRGRFRADHGQIVGAFGKLLVSVEAPREFGRYIGDYLNMRMKADYCAHEVYTAQEAQEGIKRLRNFARFIERNLGIRAV